jgi:glycosyltransferase involved in cell wall biosynthesis
LNPGQLKRQKVAPHLTLLRPVNSPWHNDIVSKVVFFLSWYRSIWQYCRELKVGMVNAHSLSSLPLAWALSRRHGAFLIYEPHELETAVLRGGRILKNILFQIEKFLISKVDLMFAVSPSITKEYVRRAQPARIGTILNVPEDTKPQNTPFRPRRPRKKTFLYLGILSPERQIPLLLKTFAESPSHTLILVGQGELVPLAQTFAARHPNIFYFPSAPWRQLRGKLEGVAFGLSLLQPGNINHQHALPNKMFQYLDLGVPVVVLRGTAQERLLENLGMSIAIRRPEDLAALLRNSRKIRYPRRATIEKARRLYSWKKEKEKLMASYRGLFARQTAP